MDSGQVSRAVTNFTSGPTNKNMNSEETEKLIDLVRDHVYLFDMRHPDYKDVAKKGEAWRAIAEQLHQTNDAVRLKWKNLRDSYMKYLKFLRGDRSLKKFKTWPWAPNLEYLADTVSMRPPVRNVPETSEIDVVDPGENSSEDHDYQMPPPPKKSRLKEASKDVDRVVNYPGNKEDKQKSHLDRIDYLFLSYAETFKKFSPRTQAVLKMEMAQMFGQSELREIADETKAPGYSATSPWQTIYPDDDTDNTQDSCGVSSFVEVEVK